MSWNALRKQIIGLPNANGKTCYINSALQCFASTPPLVKWLFDHADKLQTCQLTAGGVFCSLCEITNIIHSLHPSLKNDIVQLHNSTTPSAYFLQAHVDFISGTLSPADQQDVTEFMTCLFNHCIYCLPLHSSVSIPPPSTTFIDEIFGIKITSTIQCLSCLDSFDREEDLLSLALSVHNVNSLTDAFTEFVKREMIENDCVNCGKNSSKAKRITCGKLPPILIIYMKKYLYSTSAIKLLNQVNYEEYLDTSPYMTSYFTESNKENQYVYSSNNLYRLYGVICHEGPTPQEGHYYSYIRSSDDNWFLANDDDCKTVSSNKVYNNRDAFVLFYSRVSSASSINISSCQQQQQQQPRSILAKCNLIDSFNSSIVMNSTIERQSNINQNEQAFNNNNNNFSSKKKRMRTFDDSDESSNDSNMEEDLLIFDQRKQKFASSTPIATQTANDITIFNKSPNNRRKTKQTNAHCLSDENANYSSRRSNLQSKLSSLSIIEPDYSIDKICDAEQSMQNTTQKLASVASGVAIEPVFEKTLNKTHNFYLNPTELSKLNSYRQKELKKRRDRKLLMLGLAPDPSFLTKKESTTQVVSKNSKIERKVNIEYLLLLLPHLKHYNAACSLCIRTRYFGADMSKPTSVLVNFVLQCGGKKSGCPFSCKVHIFNNGFSFVVALNSKIFHDVKQRYSRPIRGSLREEIKSKLRRNASVYRVHAEYDAKRTKEEKQGFNFDATGTKKTVFKTIKATATLETLLSPNISESISALHDKLHVEVNSDGKVSGVLQRVQTRPFCVWAFTEASIRLYDAIVSHPESVLSWDATGGIIKNTDTSSKQCLYYELTMSHPNIVDEDSLIPLTFMLSESQSLPVITEWLTYFKSAHKEIFPHKKDLFPRPSIMLSDRAQVFLQAALRVFNEESYKDFLERAYRIVNNKAMKDDLCKTNIHACLAHFMMEMRKKANKYLPSKIRELGMWSMARLVNTSSWEDVKKYWRLICTVFLNYTKDDKTDFEINCSILNDHISKIINDSNSSTAIRESQRLLATTNDSTDPFEFDDEDDIENDEFNDNHLHPNVNNRTSNKKNKKPTGSSGKNNKSIVDEEKELNEIDSNFKKELQYIYNECYEIYVRSIAPSAVPNDKESKSIRQWLLYLNKCCMPTVVIWSNLLLGNRSRYVTSSVEAFDNLLLTNDQRTNAISERRMGIVKRTQLGSHTYLRTDVVLQILVEDMQRMIENFSISYLASVVNGNVDCIDANDEQRLKAVQENWRKKNNRGHGHYTKNPNNDTQESLKSLLFSYSTSVNDGLIIPKLPVPNWLDVAIGLLMSIKYVRESQLSLSKSLSPLINDILSFIDNWLSALARIKPPKKTSPELNQLLNTKFNMPSDDQVDDKNHLNFIFHNILLPIINHQMPAIRISCCTLCKFTTYTQCTINYIPISIVNGKLQITSQLKNYFDGGTSDNICQKCSMTMSRQLKLLDRPPVIILNVNNMNSSTCDLSKIPETICFQSFFERFNIGCPLSSIYDIVAFVSVTPNSNKLLLTTKIKKRWIIHSTSKSITSAKKLCDALANSQMIVLERVSECNTNFLLAIAKCCSINIMNIEQTTGTYYTLRDAVKAIENEPLFNALRDILSSNLTCYYKCLTCDCISPSFLDTYECICIYEPDEKDPPLSAVPLAMKKSMNMKCPNCNEKNENILLPIHKQVHHKYPSIIMYHLPRAQHQAPKKSAFELYNPTMDCKQIYKSTSAILVDEYNSISVIEVQKGLFYNRNPYDISTFVSDEQINELCLTAQSVIMFFEQQSNVCYSEDNISVHSSDSSTYSTTKVVHQIIPTTCPSPLDSIIPYSPANTISIPPAIAAAPSIEDQNLDPPAMAAAPSIEDQNLDPPAMAAAPSIEDQNLDPPAMAAAPSIEDQNLDPPAMAAAPPIEDQNSDPSAIATAPTLANTTTARPRLTLPVANPPAIRVSNPRTNATRRQPSYRVPDPVRASTANTPANKIPIPRLNAIQRQSSLPVSNKISVRFAIPLVNTTPVAVLNAIPVTVLNAAPAMGLNATPVTVLNAAPAMGSNATPVTVLNAAPAMGLNATPVTGLNAISANSLNRMPTTVANPTATAFPLNAPLSVRFIDPSSGASLAGKIMSLTFKK